MFMKGTSREKEMCTQTTNCFNQTFTERNRIWFSFLPLINCQFSQYVVYRPDLGQWPSMPFPYPGPG